MFGKENAIFLKISKRTKRKNLKTRNKGHSQTESLKRQKGKCCTDFEKVGEKKDLIVKT